MRHVFRRVRRMLGRAFATLALSGGGALVYGVAMVWLLTRSAPDDLAWLLIAPLSGAIALLSAGVMLAIDLAPALVVARFLRYLERLPALLSARPHLSNRDLARRLECSEAEASDLRRLIAGLEQAQRALSALAPEQVA